MTEENPYRPPVAPLREPAEPVRFLESMVRFNVGLIPAGFCGLSGLSGLVVIGAAIAGFAGPIRRIGFGPVLVSRYFLGDLVGILLCLILLGAAYYWWRRRWWLAASATLLAIGLGRVVDLMIKP